MFKLTISAVALLAATEAVQIKAQMGVEKRGGNGGGKIKDTSTTTDEETLVVDPVDGMLRGDAGLAPSIVDYCRANPDH